MIHTELQGLPFSCASMVFLVMFGKPENLIRPGSGLLCSLVRHASLLFLASCFLCSVAMGGRPCLFPLQLPIPSCYLTLLSSISSSLGSFCIPSVYSFFQEVFPPCLKVLLVFVTLGTPCSFNIRYGNGLSLSLVSGSSTSLVYFLNILQHILVAFFL